MPGARVCSSLARTDAVVREVNDIILKTPGVEHTSSETGFDVTTNTVAPNAATTFFSLPSLNGHEIPGVNAATSLAAVPPAAVPVVHQAVRRMD